MHLKEQSKIIGWDDGPFKFEQVEDVPVVGAITRGGGRLDGVLKTEIEKDGMNGTKQLISAINESKHRRDLKLIFLDGITYAGFNVIDIEKLATMTEKPVVAVTRHRVDRESFREGMANLPRFEERWKSVEKAGEINETEIRGSRIYFQNESIPQEEAGRAITMTATNSILPEPIRLADLIAKLLVSSES